MPEFKELEKTIRITKPDYDRLMSKLKELGRFDFKNAEAHEIHTQSSVTISGTNYYYVGQCKPGTDIKHGIGL